MQSKFIVVAAAACAVALPVASASAKKPVDAGSKGKSHAKAKMYVARGAVSAVDPASGVVTVTFGTGSGGTNKAAQAWRGQSVQFNVSASHLSVDDVNGDGSTDLNDVAVGDTAQVQARVGSTDVQPYSAKRFTDHSASDDGDDAGDDPADAGDTETTPVS